MILKIYSIYDSKVEAFGTPHFLLNKGTFSRAIMEALNDPQISFSKYPADFTAFEIGEWDDTTGTLKMYTAKINLGTLTEYLAQMPALPSPTRISPQSVQQQPVEGNH